MTTLSLTNPVVGTTADANMIASNNAAIMAVINGGIDGTNLAASATPSIAGLSLTNNAVTALQLTGAASGITFGTDTSLYRDSALWLRVGNSLKVNGAVQVDTFDGQNHLFFGSAQDTGLYRAASGSLVSDGSISSGVNGGIIGGNSTYTVGNNWITGYVSGNLRWDGTNWLNKTYGGNNGWGMLAFNGAGGGFDVMVGQATGAVDRTYTPAQMLATRVMQVSYTGVLSFYAPGGALDTNLYRDSATVLKTDGSYRVGQYLDVGFSGSGQLRFGAALDTNLYRSAASTLKTDSSLTVQGTLSINGGTSVLAQAGGVSLDFDGTNYFLSTTGHNRLNFSGDTVANLYRSGAGVLKTDGTLNAVGGLQVNGVAVTPGNYEKAIGANRHIESGSASYGTGTTAVTFNTAFASAPAVVITAASGVGTAAAIQVGSITTSGFNMVNGTGGSLAICWLAEGA